MRGEWWGPKELLGPGRYKVSPGVDEGSAAEADAQVPAAFLASGAGCCGVAQESELLETQCVLALEGTPHGSTEEAGLAPVGRRGRALRGSQKVLGIWGEKCKDALGHRSHTRICPRVRRGSSPKATPHQQSQEEPKCGQVDGAGACCPERALGKALPGIPWEGTRVDTAENLSSLLATASLGKGSLSQTEASHSESAGFPSNGSSAQHPPLSSVRPGSALSPHLL